MKKILVAGGAGYIGTLLSSELIERGYQVHVVDQLWFGNHFKINVPVEQRNMMELGIADLEGFDCVVFLGGLSNDPMAKYNPSMNFVENSAVPSYLAFAAKEAGVHRFVYASTCSVYGYTANQLLDENSDSISPQYPYGISKLAAERSIINLQDKNFRPIALRKGTVGGWSPRMRFDLVVNAMTKTALTQGKIIVNNPSIWRPLVDIRDVVAAYVRSVESNLDISGIYNISEDNYTIGRLADLVKDTLIENGHSVTIETRNVQDFRNYKVMNTKAQAELDFKPRYTPQDSVRSILKNVQNNVDLSDKRYYNIQVFKDKF
jgi:nucleoside-diphosphate-sugar epimerase